MSSSFAFNQDFGSDDEDQGISNLYRGHLDATIILIDSSQSMFENSDEVESNLFSSCLSVLERLMLNKIISSNKDLVGVVLYNTQNSPDPDDQVENQLPVPKHCSILIPLKQIEPDSIQYIKNLKNSPDLMDFKNKFGHSTDAKISDVLWLCSSMFSGCGKKIRVPQIIWFTDQDLPHKVGSSEHQQAFQKAKDLQQLQLELQFFPMKHGFDGDLFYKELFCQLLDQDRDEFQFPEPELDERALLQRMFRRGYNKRALTFLNVELTEKAKFSVGIYGFTRKAQFPRPTKLTRDTKEEIVAKRYFKVAAVPEDEEVNGEDGEGFQLDFKEKLEPSMAVKYQDCGGEKILFTPLEAYEIKQISEPKIKILGFKPKSVISERNHLKCPYFVYPSEKKIKNSSVLFRALWERCLEDEKVIICAFTMRLKAFPRLVALVPQEEEESSGGEIVRFDGFRMVFIPFAGDIRDLSDLFKTPPEIDDETSKNMKKVVEKLQVRFTPTTFENPAVKKIYSKIEENVYNEEPDEELSKDLTLPNLETQDKRIGEFVDVLDAFYNGFDETPVTKRKAAESNGEPKRKKVNADDINMDLVRELCVKGDLKSLTVPMLRSYLELKKVSGLSKLNKGQLVEKVIELD